MGFDDEGRVLALDAMLAADAGWSLDLTPGVVARALTHTDNAYWIPHFRAVGYACKTNKQSNTAFRGFGGPQGVVVMEDALDRIAPPSRPRRRRACARSISTATDGDETPYGQTVDENHLRALLGRGEARAASSNAAAPRSMPSTRQARS